MYTYTSTGFAFCHGFCGHRRTTPGAKVARSAIGAIARHGLPDVYVAEREGAEGPSSVVTWNQLWPFFGA